MSNIQSCLSLEQHNHLIKDFFLKEFYKNDWEKEDINNHFKLRKINIENEFGNYKFYNTQFCNDVWIEIICFLIEEGSYTDNTDMNEDDCFFEYLYFYGINYIKNLTLTEFNVKMNELTYLYYHNNSRINNIQQSIG